MKYRHEWKHEISYGDLLVLRQRLRAVMTPDPHAPDGSYSIRSLYFDNAEDKALREKKYGVGHREKFRIRYYNNDLSRIQLEKKSKDISLGTKARAFLSREEAELLSKGEYRWMLACEDRPLLQELYCKMQLQGLRPKTVVDYIREPFLFPAGNVRVTMDHHIRTGLSCTDFLDPQMPTAAVENDPIILEVKWDEFLPDLIRDIVQLPDCRTSAFSKYAICRYYD